MYTCGSQSVGVHFEYVDRYGWVSPGYPELLDSPIAMHNRRESTFTGKNTIVPHGHSLLSIITFWLSTSRVERTETV